MPLELRDRTATVIDALVVEDVEPFVGWLRTTERPRVNLRRCTHLHTGAVQAMLVFRPKISAAPSDHFLAMHLLPLIEAAPDPTEPADPANGGDPR